LLPHLVKQLLDYRKYGNADCRDAITDIWCTRKESGIKRIVVEGTFEDERGLKMCNVGAFIASAALCRVTFRKKKKKMLDDHCTNSVNVSERAVNRIHGDMQMTIKRLLWRSRLYRCGRRLSRLATKEGTGKEDSGSSLPTMGALCYRRIMYNARERYRDIRRRGIRARNTEDPPLLPAP